MDHSRLINLLTTLWSSHAPVIRIGLDWVDLCLWAAGAGHHKSSLVVTNQWTWPWALNISGLKLNGCHFAEAIFKMHLVDWKPLYFESDFTDVCSLWSIANRLVLAQVIHYNDVIMNMMVFQITSLTIVYSTVYSGEDQRKHQAPCHWPLCGEFTGDRWIPHTKGQ